MLSCEFYFFSETGGEPVVSIDDPTLRMVHLLGILVLVETDYVGPLRRMVKAPRGKPRPAHLGDSSVVDRETQ